MAERQSFMGASRTAEAYGELLEKPGVLDSFLAGRSLSPDLAPMSKLARAEMAAKLSRGGITGVPHDMQTGAIRKKWVELYDKGRLAR